MKKIRYDLNKIKEQCKVNNLEFIEIIEGPKNKVKARCKTCGKIIERTIDKWNIRQHCTNCTKIDNNLENEKRKENFLNFLKTTEFDYISGFVNNSTKVKLRHKTCGNIVEMEPSALKAGRGCRYCKGGSRYSNEEFVEKFYKNHNKDEYELLDNYKNSKTPIRIKHLKCGLIYIVKRPNVIHTRYNGKGSGCPYCSGAVKKPIELIKTQIASIDPDYELIDDFYEKGYVNLKHKKCQTIFNTSLPNFLNKGWSKCPKCYPTNKSIAEIEIKKFIESLGFKTETLKRKFDKKRYDIDIYIDSLKIGFEFDGLYFHSEQVNDEKLNLYNKKKLYNSIGIQVFNILEDEWKYKKEIVKEKIKNILKVQDKKTIFARKCIIKEVNSKERNIFLNENHIQGADRANFSYGLFYNDELVAVMSMSKLRSSLGNKNKKDGYYELSRFATKYHIPGGFSKLFSFIIKQHPEIINIITYADLRWSKEKTNVYNTLFTKLKINPPDYWYFDPSSLNRYHRYNFRKQVLKDKFPDLYDEKLTEKQIMDKTKYKRIWDCGNIVYQWKRKDD